MTEGLRPNWGGLIGVGVFDPPGLEWRLLPRAAEVTVIFWWKMSRHAMPDMAIDIGQRGLMAGLWLEGSKIALIHLGRYRLAVADRFKSDQ